MKTLFLLLHLSYLIFQPIRNGELKIVFNNPSSKKGTMHFSITKDDDTNYKNIKAEVTDFKTTYILTDLPFGKYSVGAFHNENNSKKMDKGWFGIPKEGYGFSNNARGVFGQPDLKDQLFEFNKSMSIEVDIH